MVIKISVLIITRNREKMLTGCLESLVKQTRRPDEVIVVNNASDDNTKEVIANYAMDNSTKLPIKYVLEKQIGIPYARNRGIKEACGTLLLMLDDDCEADKFWVERMEKAHKKYPKVWVVQGRTYSLPHKNAFSLFIEFERFLYIKNSARKYFLDMKDYFRKDFREEIEILICDTKNFSIKTSHLKNNKLSFDTRFYRGSDTDLGKQILQKNGTIMFCPGAMVGHHERSTLAEFLKQRWEFGRTWAKLGMKWQTPSFVMNLPRPKMLLALPLFCRVLNQWRNLPMLAMLLFLDRLSRINGWFYEKRILPMSLRGIPSVSRDDEAISKSNGIAALPRLTRFARNDNKGKV